LKLFNNVGRSKTVGETSGRRNHSGLPQVTSFVGSARKRGIEGVSVRGCRLDSREMGSIAPSSASNIKAPVDND